MGFSSKLDKKSFPKMFLVLMLLSIGLSVFEFGIYPVRSEPGTIHVDDDNTAGPWDGTPENPYQNITSGLGNASSGDTIFVHNGTYNEKISMIGTSKSKLTLVGENRDATIVNASGIQDVLYLEDVSNITISGFTLSFGYRCWVWNCNNTVISNNYILNNTSWGIFLYASNNNTIDNNEITGNGGHGILLSQSNHTTIEDNKVTDNGHTGIEVNYSNYTTIKDNKVTDNGQYGITIDRCHDSDVTNNSIDNNGYDGIYARHYHDSNVTDNSINNNGNEGIDLFSANHIVVSRNNVTDNHNGIWLNRSGNIVMSENNASSNRLHGIFMNDSTHNSILSNEVTNNNGTGVFLKHGEYNTLRHNEVTNNNGTGVYMLYGHFNTLRRNSMINNKDDGIKLRANSGSEIVGNKIMDNAEKGINLASYSGGSFHHNSFINNTMQAYVSADSSGSWDDGYPWGGNYWSDYTGNDTKHGLKQDQTGRDGIGDTSYNITEHERDKYPSIFPYVGHHITITAAKRQEDKTVVGQSLTMQIRVTLENQGDHAENFNLTLYADPNATIEQDELLIGNLANMELASDERVSMVFNWTLTGVDKGNYTIIANASVVPGEIDIVDNNYTAGWVIVAMLGDLRGSDDWPDGKCDMRDIGWTARYFGQSVPPAPAKYDLKGPGDIPDNKVDMRDISLVAMHFAEVDP